MPEEEETTLDVPGWWRMEEGMCTRAGNLRDQLEKETARVLSRMEVMELDGVMSDSQELLPGRVKKPHHSLQRL